jgi:hypothetical protein
VSPAVSTTIETRSPVPAGLDEHAGRWVAIRDDHVVAVSDTLEELLESKDVREDDVLYRVPERGSYFY